jgi:hypothetical protein
MMQVSWTYMSGEEEPLRGNMRTAPYKFCA